MNPNGKFIGHFEEDFSQFESNQQQFSEISIDDPNQFPMRQVSKQRIGGVQQKHKRNEKKINSRLKYQIEW